MNLKDYDETELFDDEQVEEIYEEEYENEYEDLPHKRGKKKKGYGGFIVVIILLIIAVLAALGAAVYLIFFTHFDQNNVNNDKPIYTQAQLDEELQAARLSADQRVSDAFDSGYEEGRRSTLTSLMENLISTGSSITSLRPFYPDKVIVVSNGTFNFVDIDTSLKLTDLAQENFVTDVDGVMSYVVDGETLSYKGIDVSSYQGVIDWNRVKADGVDFAIIRTTLRGYGTGRLVEDDNFVANIEGAMNAGIHVGVYVFSQAITEEEVIEEAQSAIDALAPYATGIPIVIDVERISGSQGRMDTLTPSERTDMIVKFAEVVSNAGYKPYVYYNTEMSIMYVDLPRLENIPKWYASYSSDFFYPYDIDILQYSATGRVDGITGDVDMDICFKPFW
ncbi:MAG: glycoside hydrolase family 25 protein [Lachnospiraceae bacterium]|nr:glycoside hydrolase family 25 protein [Lachnospiraceae bacterium]